MKIGIITHHYVKNFGAYMQVRALLSIIKVYIPKSETEIIDYRVKRHEQLCSIHYFGFKPKRGDTVIGLAQKIKLFFKLKRCENALPRSKPVHSAKEINQLGYDLIIIGSDEVWNFSDVAYSPIKFGVGVECPHIAYAASAGESTAKATDIPEEIKTGLLTFQAIAVRDINTSDLVYSITGRSVLSALDPVYLYDFQLNPGPKIKRIVQQKPYILVYDCKLKSKQIKLLTAYADWKGYNILGAGEYRKWYSNNGTINITPYEWAYLFKQAKMVVTGTFHGTSFAIKYARPLAVYLTEQNRIIKVESLLNEFGLKNQIVKDTDDIVSVLERKIDYEAVNRIIKKRREESITYLYSSIQQATGEIYQKGENC